MTELGLIHPGDDITEPRPLYDIDVCDPRIGNIDSPSVYADWFGLD